MVKFINPIVEAKYQTHPEQSETEIIIPALNWRSKLSQITPRVAAYIHANGSNLLTHRLPKAAKPTEPAEDKSAKKPARTKGS